ncbi:hypothetical protein [Allostreptomyces psammosilenae]|uniref:Uncharacterized protein n=1 Tax=Allostreptomyces psammosilenae TaxID=1892865 RepID=A0A853A6K2_9ACTN|nr:hypothetical protein [Allostreptomyces psammosilenae]NYI08474.1 hypothetical protein [Allostreptomyces psammosilenae]
MRRDTTTPRQTRARYRPPTSGLGTSPALRAIRSGKGRAAAAGLGQASPGQAAPAQGTTAPAGQAQAVPGRDVPEGPRGRRPRRAVPSPVLYLAWGAARAEEVRREVDVLIGAGARVDLLTAPDADWSGVPLHRRLRVHRVRLPEEGRHLLPRLEQALVYGAPHGALRMARRGVHRLARLPGTAASAGPAAGRLLTGIDECWRSRADRVHRQAFLPFYRALHERLLRRETLRALARQTRLPRPELVIVGDAASLRPAAALAAAYPTLCFVHGPDRDRWCDRDAVARPAPAGTGSTGATSADAASTGGGAAPGAVAPGAPAAGAREADAEGVTSP